MSDIDQIHKILGESIHNRILLKKTEYDPILTINFCNMLLRLLSSPIYVTNLPKLPFVIDFIEERSTNSSCIMEPDIFLEKMKTRNLNENNVINLNYFGNEILHSMDNRIENIEDASVYSNNKKNVIFFIVGCEINMLVDGVVAKYIPNASTVKRTGIIKKDGLSVKHYRKIIEKHYEEDVKGERRFLYWCHKKDNILIDSPEAHFRKHLANFFEDNICDAIVDEEALNNRTTNRTDIRMVTTINQHVYYFELKWMGKSKSGTTYNDDAPNEGMVQLNTYLESDEKAICGVLVVYDARKSVKQIKWLNNKLNIGIDKNPVILILSPHSASLDAKKTIALLKKASKK